MPKDNKGTKAAASPPASAGASEQSGSNMVLLGSSTLPSLIVIGAKELQLGAIVAGAHAASGMSVEAWNALEEDARDALLNAQVDKLRAEAAATEAEEAKAQEAEEAAAAARAAEAAAQAAEAARVAEEEAARVTRESKPAAAKQHRPAAVFEHDNDRAEMEVEPSPAFPCHITVRNNGPLAIAEPVSGVHVLAGGNAHTTLQDAEHAYRALENLAEVLRRNGVDQTLVSIEGLSDEAKDQIAALSDDREATQEES